MKPKPYKFKLSKAVHKFDWDGRTYFWKHSPLGFHRPLVYLLMHLCARVLGVSTGGWSMPGFRSREVKLKCADDLLKWHSQGHHHGASQIRNLLLNDKQEIVRIDFEEELELVFLPEALKVIDLCLMAGSLNQLFLDREQRQKVMAQIMLHYLSKSSDMNLNSIISRLYLWFQRASYLLSLYPGKLGTDAIRILDLEKCLQIVTEDMYAKPQS